MRETIDFAYFLIVNQLRRTAEAEEQMSTTENNRRGLVAWIHVLSCLERSLPQMPRTTTFERWELARWKGQISRDLPGYEKLIPEEFREEFRNAIVRDIEFLEEFLDRKPDKATDLR